MKGQKVNYNLLLIVAGLGVAYFGVLNPILKKLGIKQSAEDAEAEKEIKAAETDKAFNADYWRIAPKPKTIFGATPSAQQVAQAIYKAFGLFNDNEAAIYSAVKRARTKTMFSQIVSAYRDLYRQDLYTVLKDKLSAKEFSIIVKYVINLPDRKP